MQSRIKCGPAAAAAAAPGPAAAGAPRAPKLRRAAKQPSSEEALFGDDD
eukprot:gene176-5163_t